MEAWKAIDLEADHQKIDRLNERSHLYADHSSCQRCQQHGKVERNGEKNIIDQHMYDQGSSVKRIQRRRKKEENITFSMKLLTEIQKSNWSLEITDQI